MQIQRAAVLGRLPFPAASLLIDTRNVGNENYILDTLQEEINALYQDLQLAKENQWRFLTQIIGYLKPGPLSRDELYIYYEPYKTQQSQSEKKPPNSTNSQQPQKAFTRSLLGMTPTELSSPNIYTNEQQNTTTFDNLPVGPLTDRLHEIHTRCKNLLTARVAATRDIGKDSLQREIQPDNIVRIILLADALDKESLATAATYAGHLHDHLRQRGMLRHLTTIICMNYSNTRENTKLLLDTLSWQADTTWSHIDSCILVERESSQWTPLPKVIQEEYIEFLLYILFLTISQNTNIVEIPDLKQLFNQDNKIPVIINEKCFTFALAALTYSRRKAMTLLNNDLVSSIANTLTDESSSFADPSTQLAIEQWLSEQREIIYRAIPQQLLNQMPQLTALEQTNDLTMPSEDLFPRSSSIWTSLNIGRDSLVTFDRYAKNLRNAYTTSAQANLKETIAQEATIQSLVARNDWTKVARSPLVQVLNNAHRVLIDKPFFTDTKGAALRAKHQLSEIAAQSAKLHDQHRIDPAEKQEEELAKVYTNERHKLELLNDKFPLLGQNFKKTLQWLSFSFGTLIILVIALLILARILNSLAPNAQSSTALDQFVFPGITRSLLYSIFLLVIPVFICLSQLPFNRNSFFFTSSRSPLLVESICAIILIIFTLLGMLTGFFLSPTTLNSASSIIASWLFYIPILSWISGIGVVFLLTVEFGNFIPWQEGIKTTRGGIVEQLRSTHLNYIHQVKQYIAEAFLFSLLRHAYIIDNTYEHTGPYYKVLEQMCDLLVEIKDDAEKLYHNTKRSLDISKSDTRINVRRELLEMPALHEHLERTRRTLRENPTITDFVQILLRITGGEQPGHILKDMEKEQHITTPNLPGPPQPGKLLLHTLLTSQVLTFSLQDYPLAPPDIEFTERTQSLPPEYSEIQELMISIQEERRKHAHLSGSKPDRSLTLHALTHWARTFWHDDQRVSQLLPEQDIASRLEVLGYQPHAIGTILLHKRPDFVGHPFNIGQRYTASLLTHIESQNTRLVENLEMSAPITDFLDSEVLALLSVIPYVLVPYDEGDTPLQLDSPQDNSRRNRELPPRSEDTRNARDLISDFDDHRYPQDKDVTGHKPADVQPSLNILPLFAIARITLEEGKKAIINKTYSISAGVSQNKPDGGKIEKFDLPLSKTDEPLSLDILLHISDNIKLTTERFKLLQYDPLNLTPQFVEFPFQATASGHCTLETHFYHERRWLTAIQIEFEAIENPQ